uniref:Uncharacterized protein n=1 Tax=Cacopsylla melanoneura TaxID=428564 RepID=A0A8D8RS99_9HEMI
MISTNLHLLAMNNPRPRTRSHSPIPGPQPSPRLRKSRPRPQLRRRNPRTRSPRRFPNPRAFRTRCLRRTETLQNSLSKSVTPRGGVNRSSYGLTKMSRAGFEPSVRTLDYLHTSSLSICFLRV